MGAPLGPQRLMSGRGLIRAASLDAGSASSGSPGSKVCPVQKEGEEPAGSEVCPSVEGQAPVLRPRAKTRLQRISAEAQQEQAVRGAARRDHRMPKKGGEALPRGKAGVASDDGALTAMKNAVMQCGVPQVNSPNPRQKKVQQQQPQQQALQQKLSKKVPQSQQQKQQEQQKPQLQVIGQEQQKVQQQQQQQLQESQLQESQLQSQLPEGDDSAHEATAHPELSIFRIFSMRGSSEQAAATPTKALLRFMSQYPSIRGSNGFKAQEDNAKTNSPDPTKLQNDCTKVKPSAEESNRRLDGGSEGHSAGTADQGGGPGRIASNLNRKGDPLRRNSDKQNAPRKQPSSKGGRRVRRTEGQKESQTGGASGSQAMRDEKDTDSTGLGARRLGPRRRCTTQSAGNTSWDGGSAFEGAFGAQGMSLRKRQQQEQGFFSVKEYIGTLGRSWKWGLNKEPMSFTEQAMAGHGKPGFENHFELGEKIGEGAFGVVRKCTEKKTGRHFACKLTSKSAPYLLSGVLNPKVEFAMQKLLSEHPNIVTARDLYEDDAFYYMVMECCTGGDLCEFLMRAGTLKESHAAMLFVQILQAVKVCHVNGIFHRDLKLENVLIQSAKGKSKALMLSDFGSAAKLQPGQRVRGRTGGSIMYQAPEVLRGEAHDEKADMWAIGIILYTFLTGAFPFNASSEEELQEVIKLGQFSCSDAPWERVSDGAKDVVRLLLQLEPHLRPSASWLCAHPWVLRNSTP